MTPEESSILSALALYRNVVLIPCSEAQIKDAWAPPPIKPERAWAVYGASKAEGEKAVWEFVKEHKPHFVVNAVLPDTNFGLILDKNLPASTGDMVKGLYNGKEQHLPPRKFPLDIMTVRY